jgi:citrate lyase subunit beta/citryl-CoA lyase
VADLRAAAAAGADAVLLPKVEDVSMVQRAFAALEGAPTAIWVMIETPLGVLRAESLAASPLVGCLVAGTNDLAADLRCDGAWAERAALLPSLAQMVLAARAHGKVALDGVHIDLADDAGLAASCDQGRRLGFDGKSLIHPKTIDAANAAFTPSADEVARARAVIAAFDAAAAAGSALAVLDGKLVEELHVRASRRLIAVAEACAES